MKQLRWLLYFVILVLTVSLFSPALDAFGQEPGQADPTPPAGEVTPPESQTDSTVSDNDAPSQIATSASEQAASSNADIVTTVASEEPTATESPANPTGTATESTADDEIQSADEPVNNGTIKVFKQDQQARPVENAASRCSTRTVMRHSAMSSSPISMA